MTHAREGYYLNDYISYLESERETLEELREEQYKKIMTILGNDKVEDDCPISVQTIRSLNRQLEEVNEQIRKAKETFEQE